MIFQDAGGGLDCHALKALQIQQPACYLCPSNSALGTDLRILGKVEVDTPCAYSPNSKPGRTNIQKSGPFSTSRSRQ